MNRLVLFDFDGTLADTSEGIINSHRYAHEMMKKEIPSDDILYSVIGGPLLKSYTDIFGFDEKSAKEAVKHYREYYALHGINEVRLYSGITDLLNQLKEKQFLIGIATLKAEKFAVKMTENLNIKKYFDVIHGIDGDDKLTKSDIIRKCIKDLDCTVDNTILIGDSIHDFNGAKEAGVMFIGVSYGFGFTKESKGICKNTNDILDTILKIQ